jgi:fatty acyl-CoA reductase
MATATSIPKFFAGRSLLITGATGFMGKVLLEKLLRSCPDIQTIYILIRPKKGQDPKTRLDELLECKLFDKLRRVQPEFRNKVVAVAGDILEPELGISDSDLNMLLDDVSIVFHSAATVKFDEALKLSVQMNVVGVKKLLAVCRKMTKLEALVHVSTAYANCDREEVKEVVYPPPLEPKKIMDAIEWMDDDIIDTLTPSLIKPRPNTYTYTKAMAEYLLIQEGSDLPIAVVRPSIVGASWQEPMAGWVDNFNGPTGLLAAIGKGVLRSMNGDFNATADIIPVDLAINLMITTAWYTALERPNNIKVYNCATGQLNRLSWGQVERASYKYFMKHPVENVVRVPDPRFTTSKVVHTLRVWIDHYFPAWVLDTCMKVTGRKPMFMRIQQKLWKSVKSLEYFTSNQWIFHSENLDQVAEKLSADDKKEFNFDVKRINWQAYLENYCLGTKRYALKEDLSNMAEAKKGLQRLQRINKMLNCLMLMFVWRFLTTRVTVARNLWYFFLAWAVKLFNQLPSFMRS